MTDDLDTMFKMGLAQGRADSRELQGKLDDVQSELANHKLGAAKLRGIVDDLLPEYKQLSYFDRISTAVLDFRKLHDEWRKLKHRGDNLSFDDTIDGAIRLSNLFTHDMARPTTTNSELMLAKAVQFLAVQLGKAAYASGGVIGAERAAPARPARCLICYTCRDNPKGELIDCDGSAGYRPCPACGPKPEVRAVDSGSHAQEAGIGDDSVHPCGGPAIQNIYVRGANWKPPLVAQPCFLGIAPAGEWCILCTKHVGRHFGRLEYRCQDGDEKRWQERAEAAEKKLQKIALSPNSGPFKAIRDIPRRGVDFPCEECNSLGGNVIEEGWYRCAKCGYPGK
jgi:hypothetical protein